MDFSFSFNILQGIKGIVPCGTSYASHACTVCDFFVLLQNIINLFIAITIPLGTIAAVYIAFLFMTSGGSSSKITDAKGKLWLVLLGIFWVLGSWLVLNTILNIVANPGAFPWPWHSINCQAGQSPASNVGSPSVSVPPAIGTPTLPGATLNEQAARNQLQQAGITVNKDACPTGVSYQNVSGGCTSVDGIKSSVVEEVITLKQNCRCPLVVTGGTELGHAQGTVSHAGGYKVDLQPNPTLDSYIQNNFTYIGFRSDGAQQYKAPNGFVIAREDNHWDATFAQ
ncbi:MAG: hypothetical protein ABIJ19_00610 [Patescibacteria group bacterium]